MIPITRIGKSRLSNTRSRSIIHQGVVTTVAVAAETPASLYAQSKNALSVLDRNLIEAGTDKSRILMVMIYIPDIDAKPDFNRAWDEWVDRDNLPLRACVGADLEGDFLVELIVTAAVDG
jgi:enamine deaminase RidA (YjgF/YER057c/UK114 family)